MAKVLVFGSSGFLGKNLCNKLTEKNKYIVISPDENECNLFDYEHVKNYISEHKPDFIINCAFIGVSSRSDFNTEYFTQNQRLNLNVLLATKGVDSIKKILMWGSSLEYPSSNFPIDEKTTPQPLNKYGACKLITTTSSLSISKILKIPLVVLRPFNLYGEFDFKSVIYYVIKSIILGSEVKITRGEQIRDYLYIGDLVNLTDKILEKNQLFSNHEIYNIATGTGISLGEIFEIIFGYFNYNRSLVKYKDYPIDEYWSQIANVKKIHSLLQLTNLVDIKEGIRKSIKWYENFYKNNGYLP